MDVPPSLRSWFVIDAVVDFLAAAPLLAAPELVLRRLGWTCVDPISARLVGAALLANAAATFGARAAGVETYRALLRGKLLWCFAGAASMFVAVGAGAPSAAWAFLSMFIAFAGVWLHHTIRFRQLDNARAAEGSTPEDVEPHDDEPSN
ncbi:MAG TPA: hypothetical protein VH560_03810 [Polyangia bacterium]|jgi:hypothetical protein|nr:hypothetical protein [Polyangia bacterium]